VPAANTGALPAVSVARRATAPVAGAVATTAETAVPEGFSPTIVSPDGSSDASALPGATSAATSAISADAGQGASSARPLDPSRRPTIDAAVLRQAAAILSSSPTPVLDGEVVVSADPIEAILPAFAGSDKTLPLAAGRNAVPTTLDGIASAVPTPEKAAYGAQSILSTLHRATVAERESNTDATNTTSPAVGLSAVGAAARRDSGQASDKGADRDSGGSLRGDDARSGAIAADVTAGGSQYADILQNLPPIAQSRIGLVGDAAPTAAVGASVDVGASLQGQVIDMSVGGQWIDRVAAEITALASGNGHSRFQLSPPNLGRIQIDLWQGEDGGRVQVLTETDEAARQLRDGQSSLQADARLAALQLNSISIDKAATGFDTSPEQQQTPQQPAQQSSRHQGSEQQGSAQSGSQTPSQGGNGQNGGQNAQQAALQSGMQGGNNGGQGKSSSRRDVLNHQADIVDRQGSAPDRDGDRLVRYA
jgi:hypothetical protein